jgi:hypothetical protein
MATLAQQISLPGMDAVEAAVEQLSNCGIEERGAIFTKLEVVDFILDLSGYVPSKPLHQQRLLEPSFGTGDFLVAAVTRLIESYHKHVPQTRLSVEAIADCIRGVELNGTSFTRTRERLAKLLEHAGLGLTERDAILRHWLIQGDFLLTPLPTDFTHVIGNPPYVRQELIPDVLMAEYRRLYKTIYDRADLYIPFIERSLSLLRKSGTLGFICADRWMKNRYGGPLRQLVARNFHLKYYVDMVNTDAFHSEVIAYPAITVIVKEKAGSTRIAQRPQIDGATLSALSTSMLAKGGASDTGVKELKVVSDGSEPWILESSDQLALVRRLERDFPTLEEAGCKVGIGVATGADQVFVGLFDELDVEPDRKLPLVMTRDILTGAVTWRGFGVINPFMDDGKLVDLRVYPRLAAYLEKHGAEIRKRHVSKKNPNNWYRTIDRITPSLTYKAKLLIPDIKGTAHIVYEPGKLYPHHNLYFIESDVWDLKALQAVLMSGIARLFVSIYSTKMHGGFLRFQAQYLRRIRVPDWTGLSDELKAELTEAAERADTEACNRAVFKLYKLTKSEQSALGGNGE